jgi:starch phosphorylase
MDQSTSGWICEFARHGENSFIVPQCDYQHLPIEEQDQQDLKNLYRILNSEIIPLFYSNKRKWRDIVQAGMQDVRVTFESNRMAREYYELIYK